MPAWTKFNAFAQDLGSKVHDLGSDTLKVMLTNTLPVATDAVKADITEIAAGNGYTAGGSAVTSQSYTNSSGTSTLAGTGPTFTASGGNIGAFQYTVLYNSTPVAGPLIAWADYGSSISPADTETFKVDLTNNVLTVA